MTIISVTRTGNEADIIEPFVRHHCRLVDRMLIIDDSSSDGTLAMLEQMRTEGLPLEIFKAENVDWRDIAFITELMKIAFRQHGADWVAALDADEFLEPPAGQTLAETLEDAQDEVIGLSWSNFGWNDRLSPKIVNPVLRLRSRMPPRSENPKALVSRRLIEREPGACISHGNHGVRILGEKLPSRVIDGLTLCHYPIRSVDQFVSKCVINYLRYVARFGSLGQAAVQYARPVELIRDNPAALAGQMERASRTYGLPEDYRLAAKPSERPLRYVGGSLRYTPTGPRAMSNILHHAEVLARRVAELENRVAPDNVPALDTII